MNGPDAKLWAGAKTLPELGQLVIGWLDGQLFATPSRNEPPSPGTLTVARELAAANRAGFVTARSEIAQNDGAETWEAWVMGFVSGRLSWTLRDRVAATPPLFMTTCIGDKHQCGKTRPWEPCPGQRIRAWWRFACPDVADQLTDAWWVMIGDAESGRNDRLWPLLQSLPDLTEDDR